VRIPNLLFCVLIVASLVTPAMAVECDNVGAAPAFGPDDTGDGNATACGGSAIAQGIASTALGNGAYAYGDNATALGYNASSFGSGSTALGKDTSSGGHSSAALGHSANSPGDRSTALGHLSYANQPDTVIIGSIPGVIGATTYANVGMGTNTPVQALEVERSAAAARFQLTSFTATSNEAPQFIQRRARGTKAAPTAVQNSDNLGLFSFRGYNGSTMGGSRAAITAQAAGTFSGSSTPTRLIFSTTPVGQTTPQSVLVITPDGKVQVKGVNLNVPDFVFEEDYALMPLSELKSFIDKNGHLPGIASAQQVKDEGLDLAGSQMGLLQKVEELTLYALQQQAHLQAQQERIAELEAQQEQIRELKALVGQLSSKIAQN